MYTSIRIFWVLILILIKVRNVFIVLSHAGPLLEFFYTPVSVWSYVGPDKKHILAKKYYFMVTLKSNIICSILLAIKDMLLWKAPMCFLVIKSVNGVTWHSFQITYILTKTIWSTSVCPLHNAIRAAAWKLTFNNPSELT